MRILSTPQHNGVSYLPHVQSIFLHLAYMFLPIILLINYINIKIVLPKTKPQQIQVIIYKGNAPSILLYVHPSKLRPLKKVKTIAAKMLKAPITSVWTDSIFSFSSVSSFVDFTVWAYKSWIFRSKSFTFCSLDE